MFNQYIVQNGLITIDEIRLGRLCPLTDILDPILCNANKWCHKTTVHCTAAINDKVHFINT